MARPFDRMFEHLLRRAGFGARSDEIDTYRQLSLSGAVDRLVDFGAVPDDVDDKLSAPSGYVLTTSLEQSAWSSNITQARQRWLFRMVHTNRPLQEKMALFWHNHFATGYTKIAGFSSGQDATRWMAGKASDPDSAGLRGQVEMFRELALGNFRDLLVAVAKDTAMLIWLDGYTNVRARPQENFAREVMELFTMGVGTFAESDVYAAARVFTGWNLSPASGRIVPSSQFTYFPGQHDTTEKTFTFPIYPDGSKTIPARPAADGMQDGLDFLDALVRNPETPRYIGRKLYRYFISETGNIDERWLDRIAAVYTFSRYDMKAVVRAVLTSGEFWDQASYFARYSWPVEFVIRAIKDIGWRGFSVADALGPLTNMGQTLYDPPDVAGWDVGQRWFSTGAMLARMNFVSGLARNQQFFLASAARGVNAAQTPEALLSYVLDGLPAAEFDPAVRGEMLNYLQATGPWTGSDTQLQAKVAGLVHLVAGSAEYQLV